MTDLKPEDLAQAIERLTRASNTFPDHIGRDGVGTIRARQADVFLVLGELERRLADRARMEKALREVEYVLALVEKPLTVDPDYADEVEALGRRIGFGALMSSAQASWRKHSIIPGGEFVAGPCFATVIATLKTIRQALGASQ